MNHRSGRPPVPRKTALSITPLPLEADSRCYRIACTLAAAGYRSIVVEGQASRFKFWNQAIEVHSAGPPAGRGALNANGAVHALRSGRLGAPGSALLYAAFRLRQWWWQCLRARSAIIDADLFYLHSFEFYEVVGSHAGRLGASVIYDAHDFYSGIEPTEALPPFDRDWLRPYRKSLERRLVSKADEVITVSDGIAGLMETAFGRRPVVIRNSHEEQLDRPVEQDLRAVLGLTSSERLCVVVGNRKPGMAVRAAAAALALLPDDVHLAFVGRGYEAEADLLCGHPAIGRLHLGHYVAPDQVVPFIRSADVGLVIYEPYSENYRYCLPNGFFQTVAAGLPLVRRGLPEIEAAIGGCPIGIRLEGLDPAELAAAIASCFDRGSYFRQHARVLADSLRWENDARRLCAVIDRVNRPSGLLQCDNIAAVGAADGICSDEMQPQSIRAASKAPETQAGQ